MICTDRKFYIMIFRSYRYYDYLIQTQNCECAYLELNTFFERLNFKHRSARFAPTFYPGIWPVYLLYQGLSYQTPSGLEGGRK